MKNPYSELVKVANKSDMFYVQVKDGKAILVNGHWYAVMPRCWYEEWIAPSLKYFPLVKDGECYRRDGKNNARETVPFSLDVTNPNFSELSIASVTPFLNEFDRGIMRLVKVGNEIIALNEDYYKMIKELEDYYKKVSNTELVAYAEEKPNSIVVFKGSDEYFGILPIGRTKTMAQLEELIKGLK